MTSATEMYSFFTFLLAGLLSVPGYKLNESYIYIEKERK